MILSDLLLVLQCEAHTYPDGTVGMHDVDFSVYPEEVVALVGGNGAEKSTLLEHLNAMLVPDDGELAVDGTPITGDTGPRHGSESASSSRTPIRNSSRSRSSMT